MILGCIIINGILYLYKILIKEINMKHRAATAFSSRMIVGCLFSVVIGNKIDQYLHTTPWVMFAMLVYVIVGSLYLLIRESRENSGK